MHDTIVRALSSRASYTPNTSLKAWTFTIQRHIFYEQYRRRTKENEILSSMSLESDHPVTIQSAQDNIHDMDKILWTLPENLREALILVGAQGLSYDDAAVVCNVPAGTIKARVSRARQYIKKQLPDL